MDGEGGILAGRGGGAQSRTLDSSFMVFLFVTSKSVSHMKIIRHCS